MRNNKMNFGTGFLCLLVSSWLAMLVLHSSIHFPSALAQDVQARQELLAWHVDHTELKWDIESLKGSWTDFTPFQFTTEGKLAEPQGHDVDILRDILVEAKMEAQISKQTWSSQLQSLIDGKSDIALGAFMPAEGDDRFHYSPPYRWARISLFVRAKDGDRYSGHEVVSLLSKDPQFRIGIIPGSPFHDTELNRAIQIAAHSGRVVFTRDNEDNSVILLRDVLRGLSAIDLVYRPQQ